MTPTSARLGIRFTATLGALLILLVAVPLAAQDTPAAQAAPQAAEPAAEPAAAAAPTELELGDAAFKKRGLKGFEAAVKHYDAALKADPSNLDIKLKLVDALNGVMRVKTYGNIITVEGKTLESSANKKLWSNYGGRSERLAKEVVKARPKDKQANLLYAESFMYKSASFGIIKAITQGAADTYKGNANKLIKNHTKADGGVGYIYLGGFYLVAPWPMSDDEESAKNYAKALKVAPKSIRNRYYAGLRALIDEDWAKAEEHFAFAVEKPCTLRSEKDFCRRLKKEAKKGLEKAKKERS